MNEVCAELIGADICMRMGNVYFYGIGTEKNYEMALKYYQEAEQHYYRKISLYIKAYFFLLFTSIFSIET